MKLLSPCAIACLLGLAPALADETKQNDRLLWYSAPASDWETQALPLGNGRLGCMVFGGVNEERIQFNEDSLWLGDEKDTGAYQAFGDLFIRFGNAEDNKPTQYRRELDVANSFHRVKYEQGGTTFTREAFASRPAEALVFRFTADKPGAYSGNIKLTDMHGAKIRSEGDTLTSTGSLQGKTLKIGKNVTKFNHYLDYEAQVKVLHEGGELTTQKGEITFKNCDSITVLLVADTNYDNRRSKNWKGEHPSERLKAQLTAAAGKDFAKLKEEHMADYHSLYGNLSLDLGTTPDEILKLPTDERLTSYRGQKVVIAKKGNMGKKASNPKGGKPDPDLEELLFQHARYLMISCSRPGAMPANLQGLWNESNSPPWRSDYHSDVNIQMNYWFVDAANLSECFLPLAEWVNSIRDVRKEATQKEFGARGWLTRAENGIFGGSTYKWSKGDSSWIAQNLWDHYAFSLDEEYLRTRAYPVMKELCEF
ncbi:MAG: glycoside hydrolase family 95 protein [Luteolibacter sp.]